MMVACDQKREGFVAYLEELVGLDTEGSKVGGLDLLFIIKGKVRSQALQKN
jgi:hypothetical protein